MTVFPNDGSLRCELNGCALQLTALLTLRDFVVVVELPNHIAHIFAVLTVHP